MNRNPRETIPGWGADLDLRDRPAVPREKNPLNRPDVYGDKPVQQQPRVRIHVSTEHRGLTPIFGTSCPPHGLSGKIRDFAYKYGEGKKVHWLLLLMADRIDVIESNLADVFRGKPDNFFKEMGLKSEFREGGFRTRFGQNRADTKRMGKEALFVAGAGALYLAQRAVRKRSRAKAA